MSSPPRPDRLTGKIKTRPPKGKPEDRPLERIRQEFEAHKRTRRRPRRTRKPA
jgi:hypothetical protein